MNLPFRSYPLLSALSARARGLFTAAAGASLLTLGACSQTPVTVDLHSLQASGKVSFVCRADDGDPAGHKLDECPDYEHATRRLLGLVTQMATNEVAIVDLYAGAVVDVDPTTPGYSFLRVGASPGAIVTTPGGAASFVGVSGFQKNGVFALPTTCLSAPKAGQVSRDLTTWSACSLSSAPGEITVLVDPPGKQGIRGACDGSVGNEAHQDIIPPGKTQPEPRECPADLTKEGGPVGRRKLLVSLPDEHRLVLLDAQALLDRRAGEFTSCAVEESFDLKATLPTTPVQPVLPPDLQIDASAPGADACVATQYPPLASSEQPTPDGLALSDHTLYVGDNTLPLVHVLDVSDPCAAKEQEPLLPHSYESPNRVVTTSRVAVSPLTPSGKQYVYAVDRTDAPSSVMVFDVSPGSRNRTPIVFPNGPRQPYLLPDRLRFQPNVKDVSFVQRDFPAPDTSTGVGQFGLACDPYPDSTGPGTQYQPSTDYSTGARPLNLRGVFGFVLLSDGHIAIIDVEDFDQPCRRPVEVNSSQFEDFRGCAPDKPAPGESKLPASFVNQSGVATVTNESSCNVIETNRPRAASLSVSNSTVGLRAPTLRSFPQFANPDPAAVLPTSERPRLLAVDLPNPDPKQSATIPAQVNISAQLYANCSGSTTAEPPCDGSAQALPVDPTTTTQNSLVLPLSEPRSYAPDESPTLTFEGQLFAPRKSGFIQVSKGSATATLHDPDANFCIAGVEDKDTIATEAEALDVPTSGGFRDAWAEAHADYVQITGDFPDGDDIYWKDVAGANNACTRDLCAAEFGTFDNQAELSAVRDLAVVEASGDHLVITPRCQRADGTPDPKCNPALVLQDIHCCFPAGTAYSVRTSHQWLLSGPSGVGSASHDIASNAAGRCVHTASCEPRKKFYHARAFEVCDPTQDPDHTCKATNATVTCEAKGAVSPTGDGHQCIFENLTARFVVYRGARQSTRGMSFSWQTTGGFTPLTMSLGTQSPLPTSLSYLPEVGYLAVIDSATLGLSLFDLNSLGVVSPSPFF